MKLELTYKPVLVCVLWLCLLPVPVFCAGWKVGDLNTNRPDDSVISFIQQAFSKGHFAIHEGFIYSGQQNVPETVINALPSPSLPEGVVLTYQSNREEQIELTGFHAPDLLRQALNNIVSLTHGRTDLIRNNNLRMQVEHLLQGPSQVVVDRAFFYTSSAEVPVSTRQVQNALINNLQHPPDSPSVLRVASVNAGQLTPFTSVDMLRDHNNDSVTYVHTLLSGHTETVYSAEYSQPFYDEPAGLTLNPVARQFIEGLLNTGYVVVYDRAVYLPRTVVNPQQFLGAINVGLNQLIPTRNHVRILTLNDIRQVAWLNLAIPVAISSPYDNRGQLTLVPDDILNLQNTHALAAEVIRNYLHQGYLVIFQGRLYSMTGLVFSPQYIVQLYLNVLHYTGMINNTDNTVWVFIPDGSVITQYAALNFFDQLPWPRITQLATLTTQETASGFDTAYQPSPIQLSLPETQPLPPSTHHPSTPSSLTSDSETTATDSSRSVNDPEALISRLTEVLNQHLISIQSLGSGQIPEGPDLVKRPKSPINASDEKASNEEEPDSQSHFNHQNRSVNSSKQKKDRSAKRARHKAKEKKAAAIDKAQPASSWPNLKYYFVPAAVALLPAIAIPLLYSIRHYLQQEKPDEKSLRTSADHLQQGSRLKALIVLKLPKQNNHRNIDKALQKELDFIETLAVQKEKIRQQLSDPVLSELTEKLFDHMPVILQPVIRRRDKVFDPGLFKSNVKSYRSKDYKKPEKALHFVSLKKISTFERLSFIEKKDLIQSMGALITQSLPTSGLDVFTTFQWHMALCGKPEKLSGLPCHKKASELLTNQWHLKPSSEPLLVSYTQLSDLENRTFWLMVAAWPVSGINKLEKEPVLLPALNHKHYLSLIERSPLSEEAIKSLDLTANLQLEPGRELLTPSLAWQKVRPMDLLGPYVSYETVASRLLLSDGRIRYTVLHKNQIIPPHKALVPYVTESKLELPCYSLSDRAAELCIKASENWLIGNAVFELLSKFPDFKIPRYQLVAEDTDGNIKLTSSAKEISQRVQNLKKSRQNNPMFFAFKSLTRFDEFPVARVETMLGTFNQVSIEQNQKSNLEETMMVLSVCGYIPYTGLLKQCYKNNYNGVYEATPGLKQVTFRYLKDGLPTYYPDLPGHYVRYLPLIVASPKGFFFFPVGQLVINGQPADFIWDNKAGTEKVIDLPFNPSLPAADHHYAVINAPDYYHSFQISQPQETTYDQWTAIKGIPETGTYLTIFTGTNTIRLTSYLKGRRIRELEPMND